MKEHTPSGSRQLRLLLVSTPLGHIGSGRGGGIELTLPSLVSSLMHRYHNITVVAAENSQLPSDCVQAKLWFESGTDQLPWQHAHRSDPVSIPHNGLLPKFWSKALQNQHEFDAIVNLSYDWLPYWLTPFVGIPIFHLVTMGSVSDAMDDAIAKTARYDARRLAFLSVAQADDFRLAQRVRVVGNGIDVSRYTFQMHPSSEFYLGWAGRVSPEKGLEDAVLAATSLGLPLRVWGFIEDRQYQAKIVDSFPAAPIDWRGYLPTHEFQKELGGALVLMNTPKWNEAFGNVVLEALACGVPVVSYRRGGPAETIENGKTGFLVDPDHWQDLASQSILATKTISRWNCRQWVEQHGSLEGFATRVESWLLEGLEPQP